MAGIGNDQLLKNVCTFQRHLKPSYFSDMLILAILASHS